MAVLEYHRSLSSQNPLCIFAEDPQVVVVSTVDWYSDDKDRLLAYIPSSDGLKLGVARLTLAPPWIHTHICFFVMDNDACAISGIVYMPPQSSAVLDQTLIDLLMRQVDDSLSYNTFLPAHCDLVRLFVRSLPKRLEICRSLQFDVTKKEKV